MDVPYSVISQGRRKAVARFGAVHDLPVIHSVYDYIKQQYRGGMVLDVGAGAEHYTKNLLKLDQELYHSLDTDAGGAFTFTDVQQIPATQQYTWILLNQVLEHLTIEATADVLHGLQSHLQVEGNLVITVPNIAHPVRYRVETHLTPWSYSGLYAICTWAGYNVQHIYRYSKKRKPLDPLSWLVERVMRNLYQIDWCQSIMLVATVPDNL